MDWLLQLIRAILQNTSVHCARVDVGVGVGGCVGVCVRVVGVVL